MANIEKSVKRVSDKLKEGTDFIASKSDALTNLFDSFKKVIPNSKYSVSKPVKTSEGTIEMKAGEKSEKITKTVKNRNGFVEKIMNKEILVPALIIIGAYFGFRRLIKI